MEQFLYEIYADTMYLAIYFTLFITSGSILYFMFMLFAKIILFIEDLLN